MSSVIHVAETNRKIRELRRNNSFADVCILIAAQAASRKLAFDDVDDAYDTWMPTKIKSRTVQRSKARVFWKFGARFGDAGVAELERWRDHRPSIFTGYFNKLHGQMRDCLEHNSL
jgi:hypothetical protein